MKFKLDECVDARLSMRQIKAYSQKEWVFCFSPNNSHFTIEG
jgi:hypothetical protein